MSPNYLSDYFILKNFLLLKFIIVDFFRVFVILTATLSLKYEHKPAAWAQETFLCWDQPLPKSTLFSVLLVSGVGISSSFFLFQLNNINCCCEVFWFSIIFCNWKFPGFDFPQLRLEALWSNFKGLVYSLELLAKWLRIGILSHSLTIPNLTSACVSNYKNLYGCFFLAVGGWRKGWSGEAAGKTVNTTLLGFQCVLYLNLPVLRASAHQHWK